MDLDGDYIREREIANYARRVARACAPESPESTPNKSGRILPSRDVASMATTNIPEETQEQARAVQALALFLEKRDAPSSSNILGNVPRLVRQNCMGFNPGPKPDVGNTGRPRVFEPVSDTRDSKRERGSPKRNSLASKYFSEECDVSSTGTQELDYSSDTESEPDCDEEHSVVEWQQKCERCDKWMVVRRVGRCGDI